MILTGNEAADIVYENTDDWELVPGTDNVTSHSRWSVGHTGVFRHKPTGKFYKFYWSEGATEMQCEGAYEYTKEYKPVEVHLVEKIVIVWEEIKEIENE